MMLYHVVYSFFIKEKHTFSQTHRCISLGQQPAIHSLQDVDYYAVVDVCLAA